MKEKHGRDFAMAHKTERFKVISLIRCWISLVAFTEADLRIGELQWGDSGVYYCKVVISDDLEGKNEAHVELLVLGQTGLADDLLPGFNVEIVPDDQSNKHQLNTQMDHCNRCSVSCDNI
ncbi:hypothetical protein cypCar_00042895 [Cyprinus carpio]|nr:hypothetical protein cypCar_00042895 [Cyprinus carpio]